MHYTRDIPIASPLTLLWKEAKPPVTDTSRVGQMLSYLNYRHLINAARRRNTSNAVKAFLELVAAFEQMCPPLPLTPGQMLLRPFKRIYYRLKDKYFPEPEVPYACPCCTD